MIFAEIMDRKKQNNLLNSQLKFLGKVGLESGLERYFDMTFLSGAQCAVRSKPIEHRVFNFTFLMCNILEISFLFLLHTFYCIF